MAEQHHDVRRQLGHPRGLVRRGEQLLLAHDATALLRRDEQVLLGEVGRRDGAQLLLRERREVLRLAVGAALGRGKDAPVALSLAEQRAAELQLVAELPQQPRTLEVPLALQPEPDHLVRARAGL